MKRNFGSRWLAGKNLLLLTVCTMLATVFLMLFSATRANAQIAPEDRALPATTHESAAPTASPIPSPTVSPSPTASPTPEPTALPTATPTPEPLVFDYSFNAHPVFASGTESGALFLENGAASSGKMQIELYLTETNERIYRSTLLAPGETEYYGMLLQALQKGSYAVTVRLQLIDAQTGAIIDERTSAMTITVQK